MKINRIIPVSVIMVSILWGCATTGVKTAEVTEGTAATVEQTTDRPDLPSQIAALAANMSLRQQIGQRFMGFIPRDGMSDENRRLIAEGEIGGFILYSWNYDSLEDVRELTSRLQRLAGESSHGIPLFISADQEGGRVAAFRFPELVQLPAAFHMGSYQNPDFVEAGAYINGIQLQSIGINMNLAPVLDLYPTPDRSIIGDRSFGSDEKMVAQLGRAYIRGMAETGVMPVVKHFPGHGLTTVNSHGDLPVIESIESEVLKRHIEPFAQAIDEGARAIMTAHLLFPSIDPVFPVTLSEVFIQDMLRQTYGFDGLIMTDGLAMGAISKHYSIDETMRRCFEVGIDVILIHSRYSITDLIDRIVVMVESGSLSREQISAGAERVIREKVLLGIMALGDPDE